MISIFSLFAVTKRYSWTRFELTTILLHVKTCFVWSLFCKWKPVLIFWISVAQKGSLSCVLKKILCVSKNPTVRVWPCKAGFSDFLKTSMENEIAITGYTSEKVVLRKKYNIILWGCSSITLISYLQVCHLQKAINTWLKQAPFLAQLFIRLKPVLIIVTVVKCCLICLLWIMQ